ncbi:FBF1 factor, partial [Thryothorus ludovicianus]|nr:FBF1 factor [Thryothorus ludovicianus]
QRRPPVPVPFPQRSEQQHQDGQRALREARSVQAEQQQRLRALQEQREQLRQQEQRLHQDRLSLARQREQLRQLWEELTPGAGTPPATVAIGGLGEAPALRGWDAPLSPSAAAPVAPGLVPSVGTLLGDSGDSLGSAALYGHLLLLKHRA